MARQRNGELGSDSQVKEKILEGVNGRVGNASDITGNVGTGVASTRWLVATF